MHIILCSVEVILTCFYNFSLENCLIWPEDLVTWTGKVYQCWRLHLGDPLCVENPAEKFTQEFLRYYIIGCECTIGTLLQQEIDKDSISSVLSNQLHQDLEELYTIHSHLTIDLKLRVHSLRFFYFSIIEYEDEVLYETGQLMNIYQEHPDIPIFTSLPQYKIATKKRLEEYSKDVSLNKELEELNQYYESERYEDIVKLVLGTLESNKFTPSKDASRVPDRETQIDILIESLLHTGIVTKYHYQFNDVYFVLYYTLHLFCNNRQYRQNEALQMNDKTLIIVLR